MEIITSTVPYTLPIYGVVFNNQGLCEKNFFYTEDELKLLDPKHFDADGYEGAFSADKTYRVYPLRTEKELKKFYFGSHNGPDVDAPYAESMKDWYFENTTECLWTGRFNATGAEIARKYAMYTDDGNTPELLQIGVLECEFEATRR